MAEKQKPSFHRLRLASKSNLMPRARFLIEPSRMRAIHSPCCLAHATGQLNAGRMRTCAIIGPALAMILAAHAGTLRGDPGQPAETARIDRLIEQLGDDSFASREAATTELTAIGEPALSSLRHPSTGHHALETRWPAEEIAPAVVPPSLPAGTWNVEFANG